MTRPTLWQRSANPLVVAFIVDGVQHVLVGLPVAESLGENLGLTAAERAVATAAASGLSSRMIASQRGVALSTVSNQLASAYRKLGVGSRAELVGRLSAVASSLGDRPEPRARSRKKRDEL